MLKAPSLIHFDYPYQVIIVVCSCITFVAGGGVLFALYFLFLRHFLALMLQLVNYLLEHLRAPITIIDILGVHERRYDEQLFE